MIDILKLIKQRCAIRKYKKEPIKREITERIIEAGIWGPAIPSFLKIQPWKFVVIRDEKIKNKIGDILLKRANKAGIGVNILLKSAGDIINNASVVIIVYNSGDMKNIKKKYKEFYDKFSNIISKAELSAISAAMTRMLQRVLRSSSRNGSASAFFVPRETRMSSSAP